MLEGDTTALERQEGGVAGVEGRVGIAKSLLLRSWCKLDGTDPAYTGFAEAWRRAILLLAAL